MGGIKHNNTYNYAVLSIVMSPTPEDSNRRGRDAVKDLRQMHEERWAELDEETAVTKQQIGTISKKVLCQGTLSESKRKPIKLMK